MTITFHIRKFTISIRISLTHKKKNCLKTNDRSSLKL